MNIRTMNIAILGAGNIGTAITDGLLLSDAVTPERLTLTRRNHQRLEPYAEKGCRVTDDNTSAVKAADIIIITVEPRQVDGLLDEIGPALDSARHCIVSVAAGVAISTISERIAARCPVVRAMPNLGAAIGESMTCIAGDADETVMETVTCLFDLVGCTMKITEEQMVAATVLGACGIAFFLRAIRAASQGGIEIGFHADQAIQIAAQTAKGAAALLLTSRHHPEWEIDKVTTPRGCTISGLNQMEHAGFSSAMIQGLVTSASKITTLRKG